MKKSAFLLVIGAIAILFACKKSSEFVNPEYMCECGAVTWQGEQFQLLGAEYVLVNDTLPLSRQYYLTADVASEGVTTDHSLNIYFTLDSVNLGQFFIPQDTLDVIIEEIDEGADIPFKTYTAVNGVVNANGAVFGGTESVSMDFVLQQTVNGVPVGFESSFRGNFKVNVTP